MPVAPGGTTVTLEAQRTGYLLLTSLPIRLQLETASMPTHRNGKLDVSWNINPEGFTLMAACKSDQQALEKDVDGKRYGVFTHTLLEYLNNARLQSVTYRIIRDQMESRIERQTPQTYGRDKLTFLGNEEISLGTPVLVELKDGEIFFPIGRVHGVVEGMQFTTQARSPRENSQGYLCGEQPFIFGPHHSLADLNKLFPVPFLRFARSLTTGAKHRYSQESHKL